MVLFDEVEKAHPDVMHMLLQILEEGQLTDSVGYRVDFRNTMVIMTSNVGAKNLQRPGAMGFGNSASLSDDYERMREQLEESLKKQFKPEFINRVDDVVVFRQLERKDLAEIVDLEVSKIKQRLQARELTIELSKDVREFLIDKGFRPEYGARHLRRVAERYIEDPLAQEILEGLFPEGSTVEMKLDGERVRFKRVEDKEDGEDREDKKVGKKTSQKTKKSTEASAKKGETK